MMVTNDSMIPDVDQLAVKVPGIAGAPTVSQSLPRHRRGEKFLRGPVPWHWIQEAGRLPGRALHVGLILWQRCGYTEGRHTSFCLRWGEELGLKRAATRQALRHLEGAGLVRISRRPGRGVDVTLNASGPAKSG